jgi:hypothetical protein
MIVLTIGLAVALCAMVGHYYLLDKSHIAERVLWAEERRELLNRIQRPDQIPTSPSPGYVVPEPEPDEINDVGTVRYEPEEMVS